MKEALPTTGPIQASVYPSISHDEFGRLLRKHGFPAEPIRDEKRFGYRTLSEPQFTAWMQTPVATRPQEEYTSIFLHAASDLAPIVAAATARVVNRKPMFAHVTATAGGRLLISHTVIVHGGITEWHLREQLVYWTGDLVRIRDEIRKQTRRAAGATLH